MQPPATDLLPPSNKPISKSELIKYDGSNPSSPIYVAIKGKVFDVTKKVDMYGKGKAYNIFAVSEALCL